MKHFEEIKAILNFIIIILLIALLLSWIFQEVFMENKYVAQKKYAKNNIKKLSCSFQKEFVEEFAISCKSLGVSQAEVIRKAMQEVIDQAKEIDNK